MLAFNQNYVPTLAIRASEMNGLEFLPQAAKDRILPCFLLAPWVNSNSLDKSIERIRRAFRNRKYYLDIDRDYEIRNPGSPAQIELLALRNNSNGYENWIEFVKLYEEILPCIQIRNADERGIRKQISEFQSMGRSYCFRFQYGFYDYNLELVISEINRLGTADFEIILEGGWTEDVLSLSSWFGGLIQNSLSTINPDIPIVISCTSMPKGFTEYVGLERVDFSNRELVNQIRRTTNRPRIIYGDWASTRPREPRKIASRPHDRIDFPIDNSWIIARNRDEEWDFKRAAKEIISSGDFWSGNLNIWGEEMIQKTAIDATLGINTPQKNVASRVNIHLYRQAFFGSEVSYLEFAEEDWED